jgi:lipoprotein-anchoring transpeptidase ErfK/SrfK
MKSERNLRGRSSRDAPSAISVHAMSRRAVLAGLPLLLAGCSGGGMFSGGYGGMQDSGFTVAPVDLTTIDASLMRQEVAWHGKEKPGSIVVNVPQRRLYLIEAGGRALRYGVGVGRAEGMNFRGTAVIGRKEKWPHWTPTSNMMAAMPRYRPYAGGLDGGPDNPLGARALYLYRDGRDTFFRLHGTTEPETIGQAVSSGCIRLFNQDIIDLYNRVPLGTHVTVVQG